LAISAVELGPFGMYRASAFVNVRSMTFQPSGLPSPVQSLGSDRLANAARMLLMVVVASAAVTWVKPPPAGSRPARLR
jgi:hypothetical protein